MQPLGQLTAEANNEGVRPRLSATLAARWRVVARVLWLAAALLVFGLFVVSLPEHYAALRTHPGLLSAAGPDVLGLTPSRYATYQIVLETIVAAVFFGVAGVIFWRRLHDTAALFVAFTLVAFGAALPGTLYALVSGRPIWDVPFSILQAIGWLFLLLFAFLFPDARFTPRWTRPLALIALCWVPAFFLLAPALIAPRAWLIAASFAVWVGWFAFGLLAQFMRYRYVASHEQRQQTKWIIVGFLGAIGGVLLAVIPHILALTAIRLIVIPPAYQLVATTLATLCALLIPLSIGIAILRHRLFDIDVIVNRTLVFGSLTASLLVVYAVVVFGLQGLTNLLLHQSSSTPAIVISTLLIAALFNPLRQRLQIAIDRRFYRSHYNAARTLHAFNDALRSELNLAQLREQLLAVVDETMRPAHLSLWLREPRPERETALGPAGPEGQQ